MARLRSIKPEFWSSEQIVECSPSARLLFIGLWNFSDDGGVHPASVKRLKMEVFPADPFSDDNIADWIDELRMAGLVVQYQAQGRIWWAVTGWDRHQKIDRPTYRHPPRQEDDNSATPRRALAEPSPPESSGVESSGVESSGVEWSGVESSRVDTPLPSPTSLRSSRLVSSTSPARATPPPTQPDGQAEPSRADHKNGGEGKEDDEKGRHTLTTPEEKGAYTTHSPSERGSAVLNTTGAIDWDYVCGMANECAGKLGADVVADLRDRGLLLKACALVARGDMPEHWVRDSIEAVAACKPEKKWAYFQTCLANRCESKGEFNRLLVSVDVPAELLKPRGPT